MSFRSVPWFQRGLLTAIVVAGAALPIVAVADDLPPIPTAEQRDAWRKTGLRRAPFQGPLAPARSAALANQDLYDVTRYFLDLEFIPTTRTVTGSVTISLTPAQGGFDQVVFDLYDNMTVSQVARGAQLLSFSRGSNQLTIVLDRPFAAGEPLELKVTYSGTPLDSAGAFGWNKYFFPPTQRNMAWSLSEPEGARSWWPCKDRPDDKAMVEMWWTVPSTWTATGNGVLIGTETLPSSRKRYKWRPSDPLTTYLVSIAATVYVKVSDSYTPLAGGTMPIDHYVYSELRNQAIESFAPTASMIGFYARTFGEYPFVADKYGHSTFPFGGAMEHSTNTSYGYFLVDGGHANDYVIAHELAHQWWGDSISPQTWPDVWLNEGFATYSEALWAEELGGAANYRAYMNSLYRSSFAGPVYDPIDLFGSTVYDKGAWVNHMLRWVLGDAAFRGSWRDWYDLRRNTTGNTAQYRQTLENRHGAPLDWFFAQWVYGTGMPRYEYGWTTANRGDGTFRTTIRIQQTQPEASPFRMPVQLELVLPSGTLRQVVDDQSLDQDFTIDSAEPPTDLRFDPDNWILKQSATTITLADADIDGVPDRNDNCPSTLNPAQTDFDLDLAGDACDLDDDGDFLADLQDCAPLDPTAGTPAEVGGVRWFSAELLVWNLTPRADRYDVARGVTSEIASAGVGACVLSGSIAAQWNDPTLPAPGEALHYLVRATDDGCGGAGGFGSGSSGAPRAPTCP